MSSGPATAQIPPVGGLSRSQARSRLTDAGFEIEERREASDTIPSGTWTCSIPLDSSRITVEPLSRVVPDGGLVRIAFPDVIVSEASRRSSISKLASVSWPRA